MVPELVVCKTEDGEVEEIFCRKEDDDDDEEEAEADENDKDEEEDRDKVLDETE